MSAVTLYAAHRYYGPGRTRAIANQIKDVTNDAALDRAAADMAKLVPAGAVLVPAPSSSGLNRAMEVLADKIASVVPGASAVVAVERVATVASSLLLRRAGRPGVSQAAHAKSMRLVKPLPADRPIVLIDNVVTTGNTLRAMQHHIGRPVIAVVYADARTTSSKELGAVPAGSELRVCISGSRGFRALWKVDQIVRDLPQGTILVHGGAEGVDRRAGAAANRVELRTEIHEPDWERLGRAAGPVRNVAMVRSCAYLYAFWDGRSRGTASAIRAARTHGIPYEVILDD